MFQTWPCQTWPCQLPGANVVASPKIPSLPAHWYAATSLKPTALGCREFKCIGDKPRKITRTSISIWAMPVRSSAPIALRYSVSIEAWAYMKLIRQIVLTVT